MRLHRWLIPAFLVVLIATSVVVPATDVGREWLLKHGVSAVADAGYRLSYRESHGNPWLGVELTEARLTGPGVDLHAGTLAIDYFLPSLLTGELPVSLGLQGVRGKLDLDEVRLPVGDTAGTSVSLQLRDVSVQDVAIEVGGIPWTLPRLDVEDVSVTRDQEGVRFETTLRTAEGEARFAGLFRPAPWSLDLEVQAADARLARHWWPGVTSGTVQGRVAADSGGVVADLTVSGGSVDYLDLAVDALSGPVRFDRGLVEANLTGRGMAGPITADVDVNVPASRWEARILGRPELTDVADWLGRGSIDSGSLAVTGQVDVDLRASGWSQVSLHGRASGEGSLLQQPLEDLIADFDYDSGQGTSVDARGRLAGGAFSFRMRPEDEESRVRLVVDGAEPIRGLRTSLELTAAAGHDGLVGDATGQIQGTVANRGVSLAADARLDGDGLQVFFDGQDDWGATAEGAAVLADGRLEGQLAVRDITAPGLAAPIALTIGADGPVASLPLQLEVSGPGTDRPRAAGVTLETSIAGRVRGVLAGGEIGEISGQFGPLSLSGALDLAPLRLDLSYRAAELKATGAVELALTDVDGTVSHADGQTEFAGRVDLQRLASGDLLLGPLGLDVNGVWNDSPEIIVGSFDPGTETVDGRLSGRLDETGLALTLREPPLYLAGNRLLLSGTIDDPPDRPVVADLQLASEFLELQVEGGSGVHRVLVNAQPGLQLGPLTLAEPVEAVGEVDEQLSRLAIEGTLAGLPWQAAAERTADEFDANITLSDGERSFELTFAGDRGLLSASGSLDLEPLAALVGLPASGILEADLRHDAAGYSGNLAAVGEAAGIPVELRAGGAGERLQLGGEAVVAGVPWQLSGNLSGDLSGAVGLGALTGSGADAEPVSERGLGAALELQATSEFGTLRLVEGAITGEGVLPERLGAAQLVPTEWTATGDLASATLGLVAGRSAATLDWADRATVRAAVDQSFTLHGFPATLDITVDWAVDWRAGSAGELAGKLKFGGPLAGEELAVSGDLVRPRLTGEVGAPAVSEALVGEPALAGTVTVDAETRLPGLENTRVNLALDSGAATLTALIEGRPGSWRADVRGPGLEAAYRDGAMQVNASEAELEPFLTSSLLSPLTAALSVAGQQPDSAGAAPLVADGTLERDGAGLWQGRLELRLPGTESLVALIGGGEELRVEADIVDGNIAGVGFGARAQGRLLPRLEVELTGDVLQGRLQLAGRLEGSLAQPEFNGGAESRLLQFGPLTVPARSVAITADSSGVSAAGEGVMLELSTGRSSGESAGGLSGDIDLELALAGEPHRLRAVLTGTVASPVVDAEVDGTLAVGSVDWRGDTGNATLALQPAPWLPEPLRSREPMRVSVSAQASGRWSASVMSPLTLYGSAIDVSAALTGEGLQFSGGATATQAEARLLSAELSGDGADWTITSDLASVVPAALGALLPFENDLRPTGTLRLTSSPLALDARARLSGTVAGRPLDLTFQGARTLTGGASTGALPGEGEPAAVGTVAEGATAEGAAESATVENMVVEGEVAGIGVRAEAAGEQLQFTAESAGADTLRLAGTLTWRDALRLSLDGLLATDIAPTGAKADAPGTPREIQGSGAFDPELRTGELHLAVGESQLELLASPRGGTGDGSLAIVARIANRGNDPLLAPFDADLTLLADAGRLTIETLALSLAGANGAGDVRLSLAGGLWPVADLSGVLAAPWPLADEPLEATVSLTGRPDEPVLTASSHGLVLRAERAAAGWEASLTGTGTLPGDPGINGGNKGGNEVRSALSWSEAGGFAGNAAVSLDLARAAPGYLLSAELSGAAHLDVAVALSGTPVADMPASAGDAPGNAAGEKDSLATGRLRLSARPWSHRDLAGKLELSTQASRLWPQYPGDTLAISSRAVLSGTLTDPVATGTLALAGALSAEGTVDYGGGTGTLELTGPQVRLGALFDATGAVEGELDLAGLELEALLPAASGATVNAHAEFRREPAGPFTAQVLSLDASRGSSSISGAAALAESLTVSANLDLALADLAGLGSSGSEPAGEPGGTVSAGSASPEPPLTGTLAGAVTIEAEDLASLLAGTLRGDLRLQEAGLAGGDSTLSGSVAVSGPVNDPRLELDLLAGGRAGGRLRIESAPASGRLSLRSDLSWGPLTTDLEVSSTVSEVSAAGRIDLPGGYFVLSRIARPADSTGLPTIALDGSDRFRDWRLEFAPAGPELRVQADLDTLGNAIHGQLTLNAGSRPPGEPWLQAQVESLGWGGVTLGTVRLETASPGAEILISGPDLQASVRPREGFAWTIEKLALDLPAGMAATASGSGSAASGRLDAVVSGKVGGVPASLPLTLERGPASPLTVAGSGELLGGTLMVDAGLVAVPAELQSPDARWQGPEWMGLQWKGEVAAHGVQFAGTSGRFTGTISGPAPSPQLALNANAQGTGFTLTGQALLVVDEQALQLDLDSPYLDSPLTIAARAGEETSVRISGRRTGGSDGEFSGSPDEDPGAAAAGVAVLFPHAPGLVPEVSGNLIVDIGPLRLALNATSDLSGAGEAEAAPGGQQGLEIVLSLPQLPGSGLSTVLSASELARPASLLEGPLPFTGIERTSGRVVADLARLSLRVDDLSYRGEIATVGLSGRVGPGVSSDLVGNIVIDAPVRTGLLPALPENSRVPFRIGADAGLIEVESEGDLGTVRLVYDTDVGTADLDAVIRFAGGSAAGELSFDPVIGPVGRFTVDGLPLIALDDQQQLRLSGDVEVSPQAVTGTTQLRAANGSLRATATLGLGMFVPAAIAPQGTGEQRLDLQLATFDLSSLPLVASRVPYLSAPLSGFLQIQGRNVVGRLVAPDLAVAGETLPLSIDVSGPLDSLVMNALVAGSAIRLTLDDHSLSALATLERFPLHRMVEAVTGPTDVSAEVTGVARVVLPFDRREGPSVEVATELVRLERSGVVTTGNVSLVLDEGALNVREAEFNGAGRWSAEGSISPDLLDFNLTAEDADFGPLLGLVPTLARYRVAAQGSLELSATGTMTRPQVTLATPALQFEVAGSDFLLEQGEANLNDGRLAVAARVTGLSAVTGQLVVAGEGNLELLPLRLNSARFTARGAAVVPGLGEISDFEAAVTSRPDVGLWLEGGGRLGEPFTMKGGLAPLDLEIVGEDLALSFPQLLLASAQADAALRLRWDDDLRFSGDLDIDQARFELGIRPPGMDERRAERRGPNPVAERFVFDDVALRAPGRVRFSENFGNAELALDLTLAGNAAQPQLNGSAQVLRGTFQFSGRDFQIQSAEARFDPSRGVLPVLDVTAVTSFEMRRVQPGDGSVRFVAPQDGSRFEVVLAFTGEVEPLPGESPPFRLDLTPSLSSEALIQEVRGDGITSGPRSLSEPELLSLITLGRLELNAPLAGQQGLATAVAEGAIDTAVDLLIVSELQSALAEALGVEVVEIRTTALSSVFGRDASDPFSVSLRLGGYLSDEIFASYQIGSFDDARGLYALTNEVSLLYELGPLELDLAGRVNFEDTGVPNPDAEVSATVRYAFDTRTSLEAGIDLSDDNQQLRFGVTLRW